MKKSILIIIAVIFTSNIFSQQVGKIETKTSGYTFKKFNYAPRKIYIQDFFVNYQMLYDQVAIAKGGREIGGGQRGKAKAQLVLGIKGIKADDLQQMTDKLYTDFVTKLKAKGFTIVSADEVTHLPRFNSWKMLKGGIPSQAQFPGFVSTAPTGFKFLARKVTKKGRIKNKSIFDQGMGTSRDLGGIIVARVSIAVPFAKDGQSQGSRALVKTIGGIAKAVGKTELSIIPNITVQSKNKYLTVVTSVSFAYKENLKKQASLVIIPRKKILINDVIESKKYKAVKAASQDLWGSNYGAVTIFNVTDVVLSKMQAIKCDPEMYKAGVLEAAGKYLNIVAGTFLKNIN